MMECIMEDKEEVKEGEKNAGGRKNKQAEKGIPGTFSEVQRCFKAKSLTYTERAEKRGSEG